MSFALVVVGFVRVSFSNAWACFLTQFAARHDTLRGHPQARLASIACRRHTGVDLAARQRRIWYCYGIRPGDGRGFLTPELRNKPGMILLRRVAFWTIQLRLA